MTSGLSVCVVGAGAFGGWTALELVRRGARVTLVDAWGPGNTRSSSGGETRVIRASYGDRAIYTRLAARAFERWRAHDARFYTSFFRQTGGLWMFGEDDAFGRASAEALEASGLSHSWLSPDAATKRFPQVNFSDVRSALWEPGAGVLLARRACEHVAACVVAEGGDYSTAAVASPLHLDGGRPTSMRLSDGSTLTADVFVFACGPWLGALLPDVVGDAIVPTRQDVFYFGTPAGDRRFTEDEMPVWVDLTDRFIYGLPGNVNRGFKLADDTLGPPFDPTNGSRAIDDAAVGSIREFVAHRFPALADAPFLGGEVCQYEASPDRHLIIDRHPGADNVWIAGGGSGHGFKMGPVVGEVVADAVLGSAEPDPTFGLGRSR